MDFYCLPGSPPCGSIYMTAAAVGVKLNKITIDYVNGEHLKPAFLKLNPQHTVPTLVDNGFSIWESRAIMAYLVEKYGKDDTLYPKCPQKRAVVNQRLFYDLTLYNTFADYIYPQLMAKAPADPAKRQKMEDTFAFLNTFLEGQTYVAGDALTIADLSLISTVSSFVVAGAATGLDIAKYPNVTKWFHNCKEVAPAFEESWKNSQELKKWFAGLN